MTYTRPLQLGLIGGTDRPVGPTLPSVMVGQNSDLIAAIAPLYLSGSVLDVTYGRGMWWRRFQPEPFAFHDLALDGVDFRSLPEATSSWDSVCFDPPYVPRQGPNLGAGQYAHSFRARYGLVESRSRSELRALIDDGLAECARVARRWVLVKCTDYTNGRQFHLAHAEVIARARDLGLRPHDLIVHNSGSGPGGDRVLVVRRARRTHSYLLVFRKPRRRSPT